MHTPGAQVSKSVHPAAKCAHRVQGAHRVHRSQNLCTLQLKCAHRVQGAPLISNSEYFIHKDRLIQEVPTKPQCLK